MSLSREQGYNWGSSIRSHRGTNVATEEFCTLFCIYFQTGCNCKHMVHLHLEQGGDIKTRWSEVRRKLYTSKMEKLIQVKRNAGWKGISSRITCLTHIIHCDTTSFRTSICEILKQVRWLSTSCLDVFVSATVGRKKPAGRLHRSFLHWSSDVMRSLLLLFT